MPEPTDGKAPEVTPPTTLKVGDKEYTPEQVAELEKTAAEKEKLANEKDEQFKNLQSDYSKKAEKAKLYDELQTKADDVISGKVSASELTEQEKEDLAYMNKLGFVPKKTLDDVLAKVDESLAKVKEDTTKEVEEKLTKKEKLAQVEKEIDDLASQHSFIEKDRLKQYLSERAEGGTVLSPEEAMKLLYHDRILAEGIKPNDMPGTEPSKKGSPEEPKAKILPLGSKAMNDRIAERLITTD